MKKSYWTKLEENGYVRTTNLTGFNLPGLFLKSAMNDFVESCGQYFKIMQEFPFIFGERQTNSILLPSFSRVSKIAFIENPVSRKKGRKNASGRLDYWILYKNAVILMEVKQTWISYNSCKVRKELINLWNSALSQLSKIPDQDCKDLVGDAKESYQIGLVILPAYINSINKTNLHPIPIDEIKNQSSIINNEVLQSLRPQPNLYFNWAMSTKLQKVQSYDEDDNEIYPLISAFSYVKQISAK
jgi:hypothetical protein